MNKTDNILFNSRRINIFTGYFGSGKTEIAINYALISHRSEKKVVLIDLDIVNPYFRSREQKDMLIRSGVSVLASAEEYFDTDLPALSPAIYSALKDPESIAVLDVGGEGGARVLGRYHNLLDVDLYNLFFVVNPYRPFTMEPAGIKKVLREVEQVSRLKVTALISNPALGRETTPADILAGHQTVLDVSRQINLPVAFLSIPENLIEAPELQGINEPVFSVRLFMLPPWMEQ